jgi:hypothetical protein
MRLAGIIVPRPRAIVKAKNCSSLLMERYGLRGCKKGLELDKATARPTV